MIFSSYVFLLVFLPLVWAAFLLCRATRRPGAALTVLLLGSAVFYLSWSGRDGVILLCSILINYWLGRQLSRHRTRSWLALAIGLNLALLVYFKYASFLFGFLPGAAHWQWVLPLGISFYTFQQIAWQVDLYRGRASSPGGLPRYALFVSFFPQLIAGPIVHAREIIPRLERNWLGRPLGWQLGLVLLSVGLAKKVLLADTIAPGVEQLFGAQAAGRPLVAAEVLTAAFGYGLQLYFDFSGYGDMAVGLGLMMGFRLPTNFRVPYASTSIVHFWRRWHITLSHFLRDYLYIPLGGGRAGRWRRMRNLMVTMLLGGLWHGAGWQFLLWGGAHGALLVLANVWAQRGWRMPRALGWALTLLAVMLLWIPFRAPTLEAALGMYAGLLDWHAFDPGSWRQALSELAQLRVGATLPWLLPPLLAVATLGPSSISASLRLAAWQRGAVAAVLLTLVLKTLAERPDRAFLYFNF